MINKNSLAGRLSGLGFTLIELLVVVLIIGILAAIALPKYQKATQRSRNVQLKVLARKIQLAQKAYFLANGKYAANFNELPIDIPLSAPNMTAQANEDICNLVIQGADAVRRGKDFQLVLHSTDFSTKGAVVAQYTSGKYKCIGFMYRLNSPEDTTCGYFTSSDNELAGTHAGNSQVFCTNVEKGHWLSGTGVTARYSID